MGKSSKLALQTVKNHDFSRPRSGVHGRVFLEEPARLLPKESPSSGTLWFLGLLLVGLYGFIAVELYVSLQLFYLLSLLGLLWFFLDKNRLPLTEVEKTGVAIILVFFLVSVFTFWINDMPGRGKIYVEGRHGKFLFAILIYFLFRGLYLPEKFIWLVASAVSFILFLVASVDLSTVDGFGWPGRASGTTHPIYFALMALTMALLLIALRDDWSAKFWPATVARLAIAASLLSLFMTGSRSVWIALPLVAAIYVFSRIERLRIRHVLAVVAIFVGVGVVLNQIPYVQERWSTAVSEYQDYRHSELPGDPARETSLGGRLEMWHAATQMIRENPWLGVGTGGYQLIAEAYVATGEWADVIATHSGPHNHFLNAWVSRGVFGFVSTVLILLAPMYYCYQVRARSADPAAQRLALAVILIIVAYLVTGLSSDLLDKKPLILLYIISLALLLGQIRQRTENEL